MKAEEAREYFTRIVMRDPDTSAGVAAIKTLLEFLNQDKQSGTLAGLRANLKDAINCIKKTNQSATSVSSACELFLRFITLSSSMEQRDFEECKKSLIQRGNIYLNAMELARQKISGTCQSFIRDGSIILTHARSRTVLRALQDAAASKRFEVYVTESCPDKSGYEMKKELQLKNIPCTVILDAAVGYIMEKIDLVLVGAEGVVESGGIINKIGSYSMAVCAHTMNKPFYVLAESFKFVRLYPLNQQDVPNHLKVNY